MNIQGKNIILTGASSGIGYEMLQLLQCYDDVKIIAVARNIDTITSIQGKVYPFPMDVSTQHGVDQVFAYAEETIGGVDIFIANAGFAYVEKLDKASWNHIDDIFNLNVFSPIYSMEKLNEKIKNEKKVFVSTISGAGLASLPYYSLYCSTKSALHHFIETFRYEKSKLLKLISVYPVATKTLFFDKASQELGFPLPFPSQSPNKVAKKIIRGIENEKKKIYPSLFFKFIYPIGRAFPVFLKAYSLLEKKKLKNRIQK